MQVRERIAKAVRERGATHVARILDLSTEATLRLAAFDRVQDGTLALAEARVHRLDEVRGSPPTPASTQLQPQRASGPGTDTMEKV